MKLEDMTRMELIDHINDIKRDIQSWHRLAKKWTQEENRFSSMAEIYHDGYHHGIEYVTRNLLDSKFD